MPSKSRNEHNLTSKDKKSTCMLNIDIVLAKNSKPVECWLKWRLSRKCHFTRASQPGSRTTVNRRPDSQWGIERAPSFYTHRTNLSGMPIHSPPASREPVGTYEKGGQPGAAPPINKTVPVSEDSSFRIKELLVKKIGFDNTIIIHSPCY